MATLFNYKNPFTIGILITSLALVGLLPINLAALGVGSGLFLFFLSWVLGPAMVHLTTRFGPAMQDTFAGPALETALTEGRELYENMQHALSPEEMRRRLSEIARHHRLDERQKAQFYYMIEQGDPRS